MADSKQKSGFLSRTGRWASIIGIGILGALGILTNYIWFHWVPLEHFSAALIVAAALGASVDIWYKREISEDVFGATIGYLLPDEFKEHMSWVYSFRVVCERHDQTIDIKKIDDNIVEYICEVQRDFINISDKQAQIEFGLATDEWLGRKYHSEILEYGFSKGGVRTDIPKEKLNNLDPAPIPVIRVEPQSETLNKGEKISVWMKFREIKHINDFHIIHFTYPTKEPIVKVNADAGIGCNVRFPREGEFGKSLTATGTYRYGGTLLPTQEITIRWWDEEKAREWRTGWNHPTTPASE